jgi:hypothetical protein
MKQKIKQKRTKFIEFKIPKPSKKVKQILKLGMFAITFVTMIYVFVEFFVPIIFNIIRGLFFLVSLWSINKENIYILFFGGFLFLFIGWNIFRSLLLLWLKFMTYIIDGVRK